ncbi:MAG TPA: glycine cleavage system protein GcvH [Candidatus Aminicenantes bacterium]|nr:glycine cleavage system protein GcvH [Candidatus Aminicenantes bacterium]
MYPENFRYTKDHEWVKIEGDTASVGITDFAQSQLGDVVFVELPEIGEELKSHQTLGVVESVKAVSDIYSPISGEVTEVNEGLNDVPEILNQDPHSKGWIIKLKIKDKSELDELMSASEYEKYLEGLKDEE